MIDIITDIIIGLINNEIVKYTIMSIVIFGIINLIKKVIIEI